MFREATVTKTQFILYLSKPKSNPTQSIHHWAEIVAKLCYVIIVVFFNFCKFTDCQHLVNIVELGWQIDLRLLENGQMNEVHALNSEDTKRETFLRVLMNLE